MTEREHPPHNPEHDPYWTEDVGLFEGRFAFTHDEPAIVRARVHRSEERYRLDAFDPEIVPIAARSGTRSYLHVEPYLTHPDIRLGVALSPAPRPDGAVGDVRIAANVGERHQPVGKAQAWHYPEGRTLVLWECFLERRFRQDTLAGDTNMHKLWGGMEDYLTTRFPAATRLVTPFDDPEWEMAEYQAFLRELGYEPVAKAAFGKAIPREG